MHEADLNALVEIAARPRTRAELEAEFGRVWDAEELALDFQVTAIIPPTYIVHRRDGVVGTVLCQPRPTPLYFNFRPAPERP